MKDMDIVFLGVNCGLIWANFKNNLHFFRTLRLDLTNSFSFLNH